MKIFKKIATGMLLAVLLFATACKIDPVLTDRYGEDVLFSKEQNVELYLNGFYSLLGSNYYNSALQVDAHSDILKINDPFNNVNFFVLSDILRPSMNDLDYWDAAYSWIRNCNEFLDGFQANEGNFSAEFVQRVKAEVRFFRAYNYFELAKRYGASVILYDKLAKVGEYKSRSTPKECWDFIESDLDFASTYLPKVVPATQAGKLSKGAAFGFKARAMLYAERWQKAADAADSVIQMNVYDLHPDYSALFKFKRIEGKVNKESILEFGFLNPVFAYSFDNLVAPKGDVSKADFSPTENIVSAYSMKDGTDFSWSNASQSKDPYMGREPRFYASILYNGASWKNRTIETFEGGVDGYGANGGTTSTGYYMRKLLDETNRGDLGLGDLTYYFMRYAEVLLIYAEAKTHLGNYSTAMNAVNKVRNRNGYWSNAPTLTATTLSDCMTYIRHERMLELAFEGHRYWDLRRWGLAKALLNGASVKGTLINKKSNGSFTYTPVNADGSKTRIYLDKWNRFPIPISELQTNPLCTQFEEWQ